MAGAELALTDAAHIIQLALAPVFLLSGIATLLNVFSTRLGRVADQTDVLADTQKETIGRDQRLRLLKLRSTVLDFAVVLAALAGAATCAAVLVLFLGDLLGKGGARVLFFMFGSAILFTTGSLFAYVIEMLIAARGVRQTVQNSLKK